MGVTHYGALLSVDYAVVQGPAVCENELRRRQARAVQRLVQIVTPLVCV